MRDGSLNSLHMKALPRRRAANRIIGRGPGSPLQLARRRVRLFHPFSGHAGCCARNRNGGTVLRREQTPEMTARPSTRVLRDAAGRRASAPMVKCMRNSPSPAGRGGEGGVRFIFILDRFSGLVSSASDRHRLTYYLQSCQRNRSSPLLIAGALPGSNNSRFSVIGRAAAHLCSSIFATVVRVALISSDSCRRRAMASAV
jgi:hypothetical protein